MINILLVTLFSSGNSTVSAQRVKEESVTFKIKKGFSTINGQFSKIDYNISPAKVGSGTISGTAVIASVSTGNTTRDKHLQQEAWFEVNEIPFQI